MNDKEIIKTRTHNFILTEGFIFVQKLESLSVNIYRGNNYYNIGSNNLIICHTLSNKNKLKSFVNLWLKENRT